MKRIGVLTSGGDAPGMNAAIRAVVRTGMHLGMSVVGFKRGYNGILMRSENQQDDFEILTTRSVSDQIQRGGTFLMTARCLEFMEEKYQKLLPDNPLRDRIFFYCLFPQVFSSLTSLFLYIFCKSALIFSQHISANGIMPSPRLCHIEIYYTRFKIY